MRNPIRISALISVYKADQYMDACLADLVQQTLFQQGSLELVVVDCDSPGNEQQCVRKWQSSHDNIVYIRWPRRVSLYEAWNIGVRAARGEYLTNANADDRHAPHCLERLCAELDSNPDIALAYGDVFESAVPNETFASNPRTTLYRYKDYFAPDVLLHYQFGCQPVWRAVIHEKLGYFNGDFRAAGDYEFNLRFAMAGLRASHVAEPLGSFLNRGDSLSTQDSTSGNEASRLRAEYICADNVLKLYGFEGWEVNSAQGQVAALHDMVLRSSAVEQPWHPGKLFADPEVALCCITRALELSQGNPTLVNNFAVILRSIGKIDEAAQVLRTLPLQGTHPIVTRNLGVAQRGTIVEEGLQLCTELG